ncbi:LADA_0G12112g1_1 [Lachancea dasiensis]|uniref:LADA_0G12112g1_1 n=1 Tax=Lachancea dasiensis TaxID=1072105 RepID=A0A1G4JV83_9SACH|nr:LADA_0G12112g1_1 [Lachancea dasiensis]
MSQDAYYITPNDAALAVVATSMKKARLRPEALICNSIMGGIFFTAGGMLNTACHSLSPEIVHQNPGMVDFLGALMFPIGLFYVVINGTDLFNSNVLFFSVGVLRRAVSIYDLLISWAVSWFGNLAGTLFVVYVICHLSGSTRSAEFVNYTRLLVQQKDSFSFVEIFIKAIAGNFFVCLAIYLQLMAKSLHVKFLMLLLPIFTFVASGFTHVVADMFLLTVGMLNGADLPVSRFIWKHMIPSTLGNVVGGSAFGLIVPFYLHLVVVEADRKRLSLPHYEMRDEQPELNMDSRVIRIPTRQAEREEEEAEENEKCSPVEEDDLEAISTTSSSDDKKNRQPVEYRPVLKTSSFSKAGSSLRRVSTNKSVMSTRSTRSVTQRTPIGVFPVMGMASPFDHRASKVELRDLELDPRESRRSQHSIPSLNYLRKLTTSDSGHSLEATRPRSHTGVSERGDFGVGGSQGREIGTVIDEKMGTRLERTLSRVASRVYKDKRPSAATLPSTNQDTIPHKPVRRGSNVLSSSLPQGGQRNNSSDDLPYRDKSPTDPGHVGGYVPKSSGNSSHGVRTSQWASHRSYNKFMPLRPSAAYNPLASSSRGTTAHVVGRYDGSRYIPTSDNDNEEEQSIKD